MIDIKDKIRKLLALGTSPNMNEAKAALLKAKELMLKYKLADSDFKEAEQDSLQTLVCDEIYWTTDSGKIWLVNLCRIIGDNYMCATSWLTPHGTRTHKLVVAGVGEDAEICRGVIDYAVDFMESAIKILQRKHVDRDPKAVMSSYASGFLMGLEMAFENQRDEHPEWGLVPVKPEQVNEYEKNLGNRSVKTNRTEFDPLAHLYGQEDGRNFNPRKVLEGGADA